MRQLKGECRPTLCFNSLTAGATAVAFAKRAGLQFRTEGHISIPMCLQPPTAKFKRSRRNISATKVIGEDNDFPIAQERTCRMAPSVQSESSEPVLRGVENLIFNRELRCSSLHLGCFPGA